MSKKYNLTNVESPSELKTLVNAYGLNLSDISRRSGYSYSTVGHMLSGSTSTRPENYMIIRRTILNMIDESSLDGKPYPGDCIRNIAVYLRNNNISYDEFADMCDISHNWFYGFYTKNGKEIAPTVVSKILKVTGWTSEQLRSGKLGDIASIDKPVQDEVETCDISTPEEQTRKQFFGLQHSSVTGLSPTTTESKNHKYRVDIDEDGTKHYICEYDLVQTTHVTKEITREQFIQEV